MTTPGPSLAQVLSGVWSEQESEPGYFAELGRMITAYANAEAAVHVLARHLSGMPDVKARAIFGRMRLPDLIELIRQMMRVDEKPDDVYQEIDTCLIQLNLIANERHKLVHRPVVYTGSQLRVRNDLTAKSFAALETDVFSYHDLENMEGDRRAIFHRLLRVITPTPQLDQDPEFNAFVSAPWRYKPPQRASGKKPRGHQS